MPATAPVRVVTFEQALNHDLSVEALTSCAAWNAERADNPMSDDTYADVLRHRRQAAKLCELAAAVERHRAALAS